MPAAASSPSGPYHSSADSPGARLTYSTVLTPVPWLTLFWIRKLAVPPASSTALNPKYLRPVAAATTLSTWPVTDAPDETGVEPTVAGGTIGGRLVTSTFGMTQTPVDGRNGLSVVSAGSGVSPLASNTCQS